MNDPKSYDPVTAEDDDAAMAEAENAAEEALLLESDRTEKTMTIHQDPNRDDLAVVPHEIGCVMRVRARGLDGEPMLGLVWLPGVTLADVQTDPAEARRILAGRPDAWRQTSDVLRKALLLLDTGDHTEARKEIASWLGVS